jgi:7-cyano-7-deazaguanine synthase
MKKHALALCSGGPDGVVAAAELRNRGYEVALLFVNYGQVALSQELKAVSGCAIDMGMALRHVDMGPAFASIRSDILLNGGRAGGKASPGLQALSGKAAFVPARNLILLSVAAGMAESLNYGYLCIGNIADGRYPDNQPEFCRAFDALLPHALSEGCHVRCLSPVNHLTKADVLKLGVALGAPLHLTYSCYAGLSGGGHCGVCASCLGRRKAFAEAGITDPTYYLSPLSN